MSTQAAIDDLKKKKTFFLLIKSGRIVDDGALEPTDSAMQMSMAHGTQFVLHARSKGFKKAVHTDPKWWLTYGEWINDRNEKKTDTKIRCDGCTALAFYLIHKMYPKLPVHVVEQGTGNAVGHWFILVGDPASKAIQYNEDWGGDCFVVDLWGAYVLQSRGTDKKADAVVSPARCLYSVDSTNKLAIRASLNSSL